MTHQQGLAHQTDHRLWVLLLSIVVLSTLAFSPGVSSLDARVVRVGVYQNEPKIFMTEDGKASGFFIDLLEKIAVEEGWTLEYVPCEWADCLQALEEGGIDLMPDVAFTQERDEIFDFHKTPVIESWSRVYAHPWASIEKLSDLDGKTIAVLQGSVQQTVFQQLMDGFGYQVTLVPVNSFDEAFTMAGNGSVDAAITNQLYGDYFYQTYGLVKTTIDFDPVALFYATAEGRNQDLLVAIDRDLALWIPEPNSPYYTTLGNWTPPEAYHIPIYVLWIFLGISGLFLISSAWVLLLRQQVGLRTRKYQEANAELLESRQRYQTLANISPVGIFRTDADGSTTYVNPKWSQISGLPSAEAVGNGWLQAVHPEDREKLSQGWEKSTKLHRSSYSDYRFIHPDGTVAWVMGQAVPELNAKDQIIGYVGTITDITERKEAEEEIRKLNVELEDRVAQRTMQLQAANKELESFSYSVSHDLRAPLRAISGFSEIIAHRHRAHLNDEGQHYVDNIIQASTRMGHLIDDLLTYARIGRSGIRLKPVSLADLMKDISTNMQSQLDETGGTLNIQPDLPIVSGDSTLLLQAFTNILENALKYHQPDLAPQIWVRSTNEASQVTIEIKDNGIGIAPEYHEKIFNVFQRLHSEEEYPGTGIGLATVKKAIELLGGSVRVESKLGEGSSFFVSLPME
jgi:PAS domain S-box-containing protein